MASGVPAVITPSARVDWMPGVGSAQIAEALKKRPPAEPEGEVRGIL
jgi:hypothetical protein